MENYYSLFSNIFKSITTGLSGFIGETWWLFTILAAIAYFALRKEEQLPFKAIADFDRCIDDLLLWGPSSKQKWAKLKYEFKQVDQQLIDTSKDTPHYYALYMRRPNGSILDQLFLLVCFAAGAVPFPAGPRLRMWKEYDKAHLDNLTRELSSISWKIEGQTTAQAYSHFMTQVLKLNEEEQLEYLKSAIPKHVEPPIQPEVSKK